MTPADAASTLLRAPAPDDAIWQGADRPVTLDLRAMSVLEPRAPEHIIDAWLPAGEVTLLAGHGGAGKSYLALYLACAIALGMQWCGMPTVRRRVLYLSCEDGADILHWRLARIAAHLGVGLADLAVDLRVIDASRVDADLMVGTRDGAVFTPASEWLAREMIGRHVLVVDGASDVYGASEIVRSDVRRFVRALRRMIPPDGAVVLVAHINRATARGDDPQGYSGSTAWHNSCRARWYLSAGDDGTLTLALAKANHARAGAEIRLRWDARAHVYVAEAAPPEGGVVGAILARQEREGILAAMGACAAAGVYVPAATTGNRTAWHVLAARPELPAALRSVPDGRRRFWRLVEELRAMRAIEEASIRRADRHYVAVLRLATEERAQCGQ